MMDLRAVHRYSRALYELAEKQNLLDLIDDQLIDIRKLVEKHTEISNLVSNSTISSAEKEDFISKIVPGDTQPLLINFLKVLIKKKRFREFAFIQEEFHRIYEKNRRVEEVTAVSAVPLSRENAEKLEKVLEEKLKSDIRLVTKVDPAMIGGLVLQFAGNEINASFRSRLDAIEQVLKS